jgi:hypothetical protein
LQSIYGEEKASKIKIVFLPNDILVRAGPRVIDAIQFIKSISNFINDSNIKNEQALFFDSNVKKNG